MANRHHAVHPPSAVSPNLAVNKKPNVASGIAAPNPNPVSSRTPEVSAVPPGVKAVARDGEDCDPDVDDDCDDETMALKIS